MLSLYTVCSLPGGFAPSHAEVAELADALASGASGRKVVEVQILSSAPFDSPAALPSASQQARSWQAILMSNALSERSESKGLVFLPPPDA